MHSNIPEGPPNVLWADFPRHRYTIGYGLPDMNRYGYQGPLQVPDALKPHDRISGDTLTFRVVLLIFQLTLFAIIAWSVGKSFPPSQWMSEYLFLLIALFWLLKSEVNVWRARKRREKRVMRYLYCPSTSRETPQ